MPASCTVNGVDLTTLGFRGRFTPSLLSSVPRSVGGLTLLDRAGPIRTGPRVVAERRTTLRGPLVPATRTVAGVLAANEQLKDLVMSGLLWVVETDSAGAVRKGVGVCTSYTATPLDRRRSPTSFDVAIDLALDAYVTEVQPTIRSLAVAGTRYTLPLGTAPSDFVARIMGSATNPTLTYRSVDGTVVFALGFTVTLASTDYLEIDTSTGVISRYVSGVRSDAMSLLTTGQESWPRGLDPQDGDYTTSQWPTMQVTPGTGDVIWVKRWL